jgi:hypothetical protein
MSGSKYPNSGVLWVNSKKTSDKHPDMTGSIEMDRSLLQELINQAKEGKDIKVDVSAWKKKKGNGEGFLSLTVKKAWEKTGGDTRSKSNDDDDIPF